MKDIHGLKDIKMADKTRLGAGDCPVKLGDRFNQKPAGFVAGEGEWCGPVTLTWTVIYINPRHRYYTAEAVCHGATLRESFKF